MADDDDVVCPLPALRKVRRRRQYTTGRRARTNGYEALDHDSRIIGRRTPAATHARPIMPRSAHARPFAGLRAALRGRLQALLGLRGSHRAEGRGCGTSVKQPFPRVDVVDANADATRLLATPRRHRADSRPPTTRDARARHRRDRTKKHRRRLRALLLRLAQVHRQVRDAAHHAEAQVVL